MRLPALVIVLGVLVFAAPASASSLKIHHGKAKIAAVAPYDYTQRTFKCAVSTIYGSYATAVTWHWSWYIYGGWIKNAWRETVAPTPPPTGNWIYNRSWVGATSGGLGGTAPFYGQTLISHFYFVVEAGGVVQQKNAYLSNNAGMYAGGSNHSCSH